MSYAGGLGHKYLSVIPTVNIALSYGYKWYCRIIRIVLMIDSDLIVHLPMAIWNATQNCFYEHQYLGVYNMNTGYPQYPISRRVGRNHACKKASPSKFWANQDVVMTDCRPKKSTQYPATLIQKLKMANINPIKHSRTLYEKTLYRIFLNPSSDVIEYISKFKKANYILFCLRK